MEKWVEVARALVQIGKKDEAVKVLKSKILGTLLLVPSSENEDTIVKGLFVMIAATTSKRRKSCLIKILRRRILRSERFKDDMAVLDMLESKPTTYYKTQNRTSPLILEFVKTNAIHTYRWRLSNKVELMLRMKDLKLSRYMPRTSFLCARECKDVKTRMRICREIGSPKPCWFVKRGAQDRGEGIVTCFSVGDLDNAVTRLNNESSKEQHVRDDEVLLVQQCPERLVLWNSRKFHLRVFVLCEKHVRRIWLFGDAIMYASTSKYQGTSRKAHLTNFSQQDSVVSDTFQGVASKCLTSKTWFCTVSRCVHDVFSKLRSSLIKDEEEEEEQKKEETLDLFDVELLGLDMLLVKSTIEEEEVKILEINQLPHVNESRQTDEVRIKITRPMINGICKLITNVNTTTASESLSSKSSSSSSEEEEEEEENSTSSTWKPIPLI